MNGWDAARWHAATVELDALLNQDARARETALAKLRARDAGLADDVAALLRNHAAASAEGFLEQDAAPLVTRSATAGAGAVKAAREGSTLPPGSTFGAYTIRRVLGRGGMGIVYEAEEADSGRRVALKVLQQRLGDARERERFEREGRLAASIDHEHCVFVFAATEVNGVPAIAMEPMQGTLADRLASDGPLAPAAAVDAALQLVAGLDAAARAGVLHRDVKPSNCFVDGAGAIKIGDFGISRSMRPTEETALSTHGKFAATPTYASPEQLRGATLDVRADIYSLGATLYELLTGTRPFVASDLMALLMAVANDAPKAPHLVTPSIPRGLSGVILRCLAKRPEDRYASYAALAAALEPYASVSPTPATFGKRFVAGVIDHVVLGLLGTPATVLLILPALPDPPMGVMLTQMAMNYALLIAYYGGSEAVWARTIGKALLGLILVDAGGRPPRPLAALGRAALFGVVPVVQGLVLLFSMGPNPDVFAGTPALAGGFALAGQAIVLGVVFSTARRRNGYAALHDLASRTRVVERRSHQALAASAGPVTAIDARPVDVRGPFAVLDGAIEGRPGWRPGLDERLRRPIWIRDDVPGTPAVTPVRAAIARPTRLRWLAGRRTDREAWDVYEGVTGVPLAAACRTPRSWREVRRWLHDLAQELAAQADGDRPPLAADRVWILDSGRAKLLDDPAIDVPRPPAEGDGAALLADVVRLARGSSPDPWPLGAERFLDRLAKSPAPATSDVVREVASLECGRASVGPGWRALTIAAQFAFPMGVSLMMVAVLTLMTAQVRSAPPDVRVVALALRELSFADGFKPMPPADREAIETVLATRYRPVLGDPGLFRPQRLLMLSDKDKALAQDILRRRPAGDAGAAEASPAVRALVDRALHDEPPPAGILAVMLFYGGLVFVALSALLFAVVCRGLILRLLGFEIVRGRGRPASRLRVLARTAIAWSPLLAPVLVSAVFGGIASGPAGLAAVMGGSMLVLLTGGIVAIARPRRGLQDRLAGTWIVPR